jgi:hypothetical protein
MIPVLVQIVVRFLRRSLTHLDMKSRSTSDELWKDAQSTYKYDFTTAIRPLGPSTREYDLRGRG